MPRSLAPRPTQAEPFLDFSGGLIAGLTDLGRPVRHVKECDNVVFDLMGGIGVRPGYRDVNSSALASEPHSLMKYYNSGGNKTFVGAGTGIYQIGPVSYSQQSLPGTWTSRRWTHTMINGLLVCAQEGAVNPPIAYNGSVWYSIAPLVAPTVVPTFNADSAGGSVDAGNHFYRIRYRYRGGSSVAGTPTSVRTVAGPNNTVNLVITAGSGQDYLGWRLERTKAGATNAGPWYYVADGTAGTYADTASDASINEQVGAEPGVHGACPPLDGITSFRNLLIGWAGTNLYVSQAIADTEASGSFNFHPFAVYPVRADDGDPIMQVLKPPGDQLLIFKSMSCHSLTGFDRTSFQLRELFADCGVGSTRGAVAIGPYVIFYSGQKRLYQVTDRGPVPIGEVEIGPYLANMDTTKDAKVELFNYRGDYMCMAYTATPDSYNRDILAWRLSRKNWTHWKDLRVGASLVPKKVDDFAGATLLVADPKPMSAALESVYATKPWFSAWGDSRVSTQQVYVQKFDSLGVGQWAAGGVQVGVQIAGGAMLGQPAVMSDGDSGGCFVVWTELQSGSERNVFAQRFNASGVKQWAASGVSVAAPALNDSNPAMCHDAAGGFICGWENGSDQRLRLQRLNSSGVVQWTAGGISLGAIDYRDDGLRLYPDGSGGAFAIWTHHTGSQLSDVSNSRANRIDSAGNLLWGATGLALGSNSPASTLDGQGGLYVANGFSPSITVKRVNAAGSIVWTSPNVVVGATNMHYYAICRDGDGGVFVFWTQETAGSTWTLRCQRVTSAGNTVFPSPLVLTAPSATEMYVPRCVQDGAGGAIVTWRTNNSVAGAQMAQRISLDGVAQWTTGGVQIKSGVVAGAQDYIIITDAAGGAYITWRDNRSGNDDLYVQRVTSAGAVTLQADGKPYANAAGNQGDPSVAFTNSLPTEYPFPLVTGYHVWSAFDGFADERAADGTGGIPIDYFWQTPQIDEGAPDVKKDVERFEFYVLRGSGSFVLTIAMDGGTPASVSSSATIAGARWGDKNQATKPSWLVWGPKPPGTAFPDNPDRWGGRSGSEVTIPLPKGTVGKKYALGVRAQLRAEFLIGGFCADWKALPERSM